MLTLLSIFSSVSFVYILLKYFPDEFFSRMQVFNGNFDRHTVVSHLLVPRITAQFVRIYPYRYRQFGCLRVEYYGCAVGKPSQLSVMQCFFYLYQVI